MDKFTKRKNLRENVEIIQFLQGVHDFKVDALTAYQYRLYLPVGIIDFYPISGKACYIRSAKWTEIDDIDLFITKIYKDESQKPEVKQLRKVR